MDACVLSWGWLCLPNKETLICKLVDIKQTQCYCGFNYDGFKRVSDIKKYTLSFIGNIFSPPFVFVLKYQIQSAKKKGTISLCFQLFKYVEITLGMKYTKA